METTHGRQFKYGLHQAKVGAQFMVPTPGSKKKKAIIVGDKSRYPSTKFVVVCFRCGTQHESANEMMAMHPTLKEMQAAEEMHPWAYFSEEPAEAPSKGASKEEIAAMPRIGFVSEEDWK